MSDFLWLLFFIFCVYVLIAPKGLKEIQKYDDFPSSSTSDKQEITRQKSNKDTDNKKIIP